MFPSSPNQPQHMMHHNNSNPPRPTRRQEPLPRHPYNPYPPLYQQPPFTDPSLQQFLGPHTHTSPWGKGSPPIQHYHSPPNSTGPSRVVAQQYQNQYELRRPGPSHNQNGKGDYRTEVQYNNHFPYVSSRMISRAHSTNIHPVNTQMGAFNNTTTGWAWSPPPRNPLVVNNDWQRARPKPYDRDCTTQKKRPRKVNLSMYQVPITASERKLIWPSIHYQLFHRKLCAGNATEHSSNVPTPTSATAGTTQKTANVDKQERTHTLTNS